MSWDIAGMSVLTSVGEGVGATFEALCAGQSGVHPLRVFDPSMFRTRHAYEIGDREPETDQSGRATRWLGVVVAAALKDAGLGADLADVPVLVGTGLRELRSLERWWVEGADVAVRDLHFGTALRARFGAARTYTFANACSASLYALGLGADLLSLEQADHVVVAGVDAITASMFGLLDRVQLDPPQAVRPFDRDRKGVLMGDGAAAVVLRRSDGTARSAPARARLLSVGMNCDAYHVTAPDPKGIAAAIRDAHRRAGLTPEDLDLVVTHGTGTVLNDAAEAWALCDVFGGSVTAPLMTAIKSMIGHTSGASGLVGLVMGVASLESGRVPPVVGLSEAIEDASGFRFVREETRAELVHAQIDAFGFGGVNAVAVVEKVA